MNERKTQLRSVMLDIIAGREKTKYEGTQEAHLLLGVAEVLNRRTGKTDTHNVYPRDEELQHDDKLLAQEIFWDLLIERTITPGWNFPNSDLPNFRVHSEAKAKLEK